MEPIVDRKARREAALHKHRCKRYGIDVTTYEEMLAEQGNCCAICGAEKPGGKGAWHIDHDHETGTVRGLLCMHCNSVVLRTLENTPAEVIESAQEYIARHAA